MISPTAIRLYRRGVRAHKRRRIGEALRYYRRALEIDPPKKPADSVIAAVRAAAPILRCAENEPLPLNDVAAVLSPSRSIVGYHLFYEDDIDFPNDTEPCDHEVIWVELDPASLRPKSVSSYFHSHVVPFSKLPSDATRPVAVVQWGKHGTLPPDWQREPRLNEAMQKSWHRLHTEGSRERDTPLARFWPDRYEGSWQEFCTFSVEVPTEPFLAQDGMILESELATAVLDFCMIPYNFAVKYGWPDRSY